MPNISDDRPRRTTTGGPSTPEKAQAENPLPETPERPPTPDPYRRSPALVSTPLVICEQDASTTPGGASDVPPDAEYVCIPSSDGEYRLQEINFEASSPQQDGDNGLAESTDAALESSPADATGEATTSTGQRRKRPREERKGKKKPKKPRAAPVPEPCDTELDKFLEDTAEKNNLTVTNVKNIIRRVVSNSRVLAMLQNTMISHVAAEELGTDLSSLPYEPKFTRAKAREIMEKQPHLLWQVSPMKLSAPSGSQQLLQQEFPDESSSDEEYHPASEESEDDITEPPSSVGSSVPFSPPASDAVLDSPEKQDPSDAGAESGIAERTRSKLPLHDTPLECIEAQFIAPDITTDMYDTECDDEEWKDFLVSLVKPFEQEDNHEDDVEDPEYTVQDEEEENFDSWDVRNDHACKIPQKEVSDLMTELMQAATRELLDNEEEEDALLVSVKPSPSKTATATAAGLADQSEADIFQEATESVHDEILAQPTPRQIQQLEEQMRMHVQLLAQMCLLCSNNEHLSSNFEMARKLLKELGHFAARPLQPPGKISLFNTCNLPQAIRMLDSLSQRPPGTTPAKATSRSAGKKKMKGQVPSHARDILLDSPVFIYPDLLPISRMYSQLHDPFKKVIFFPSEDHLLALGLEQFVPPRFSSFSVAYLRLIRTFLLPVKTEVQIKVHVKNIIYKKLGDENPIKYWHIHKVAPPLVWEPHPIELRSIVPPSKRPLEILPMWMQVQLSLRPTRRVMAPLSGTSAPPPPIRPASSTPPTAAAVVCSSSSLLAIGGTVVVSPATATGPATLTVVSPTTPRHTVVSPLKQISPILKKYSQYGRKILLKTPVKKRLSYDKEPASSASTTPVQNSSALPERTSSADTVSQPTDISGRVPRKETLPAATSEEAEDNEGDLAALMAASSTILRRKQALSRKRSRQQKDAEATLPLLVPGLVDSDPLKDERENQFTQQYLNRVQEALKDDEARHQKFIDLMKTAHCDEVNPVELYKNIEELLHDHQDLVDDFVGFLLPEQALQCGKLLQYLNFRKIHLFLRKLEVHLGQQPQQLQRLLRSLHQLQRQSELTAETVFSVLQPLLRGQSHLMDELQQLLPSQGVPDSLMEDFEEVTLPEEEEEEDEEEGAAGSPGGAGSSCEELTLSPPRDTPGTPQCPCTCHQGSTDSRFLSRARHCTRCGIKFLDGRVFLQTGKVLRPARVTIGRPQSPETDSNTSESQMSEKHAEASKSAVGKDGGKTNSREGQSIAWSREDDKVLLQACQQLGTEKGLQRASQTLGRPPEQVASRFQELIRLFEASKSDDEADS
ncbi:GON-4-like protein isoform X1 [Rhipicephalus sanguineus]|uniref:GON-4-like protein isoform X1 n=1 Tax=Rhipicephalus sanguineus TaxID=34632 RepID=UPI00189331F7|nr:GON-4-like protein isoform X1 [Rhipicephalus sanguineus]